ncbi:MAG: methylenetetrahydrofolate--tRNA-(uracil(54)-C(5))-methyltransferase (FADH(2)-oxidizing) TrmFO [Eubacteriales bacterium]|jgi:methylenetetrahydrofolate--tRNA-(uracil-5-)-methyltransferase
MEYSSSKSITVIGAGLAGCEAAWQAAKLGAQVTLIEMKPRKMTPAHRSPLMAELVCSNSLRSADVTNAVGLLKEEMRRLGSLIIEAADKTAVPAGSALAVDREAFSSYITDKIRSHPAITVVEREAEGPSEGINIIATGPLTAGAMADYIKNILGRRELHFFDAVAPIVDGETIDYTKVFAASRYGRGGGDDYLNCPMTREEYDAFYDALINARVAELHDFDEEEQAKASLNVFEGCMPVEVMARRGRDTLRFGPMKPVGLIDPRTGKEAYAIVQLRRENATGTMYNIVGFQTHLAFPEQKRVFSMIPGLENAEFLRYGVIHRNTYINSPGFLTPFYSVVGNDDLYFAGQITGVEGYVESAASGLVAGINAARHLFGQPGIDFTTRTVCGAMAHYVATGGVGSFVPMNANFGIVEPLGYRVKGGKRAKNAALAERSLAEIDEIIKTAFD